MTDDVDSPSLFPPPSGPGHEGFSAAMVRLQNAVATGLGVDDKKRTETVGAMLENNRRRAPGYWIQLFLAMGIATLGLVLGSTAVVIGAMLVSPLMGPIVELGMGFAVGSTFLVFRASLRVAMSVVAVVAGAAILTLALPFHEITGEIASRSAPTALDLFVAIFCALTAAYTTVRPASDTTAAAAGTAIGIALVPPLGTIGFGLGTLDMSIAGGAALLFTANFSAILVFTVISFMALGFNQVRAQSVEAQFLDAEDTRTGRAADRAHALLARAFGSRYGLAMRLLVPLLFLGAVYVPLRRALDEVTWEVRTRDAIRHILSAEANQLVQTTLIVKQHAVSLRLLMIGSPDRAAALEARLDSLITRAAGTTPTLSVTAVPDARTLATARTAALSGTADAPERVNGLRENVGQALSAVWPRQTAGQLAGWEIGLPSRGPPTVIVRHLGAPLGESGAVLLGDALSTRVGLSLRVIDRPASPEVVGAASLVDQAWFDNTMRIADWLVATDSTSACVTGPFTPSRRTAPDTRAMAQQLVARAATLGGRMVLRDSSQWSVRAVAGPCPHPDSTARAAPPATLPRKP